jgi:hypothetical protein
MFRYIFIIFLLYMFLKFQIDTIKNKKYTPNPEYIKIINEYKM